MTKVTIEFYNWKPVLSPPRRTTLWYWQIIGKKMCIDDFDSTIADSITCLFSKASSDKGWLWHKKLSHLNFKAMYDLVKRDLVWGMPKLEFSEDGLCDAHRENKGKHLSNVSQNQQNYKPLQFSFCIWFYLDHSVSCQFPTKNTIFWLLMIF